MEAWTDERLDDLAASLRPIPAQVAKLAEAVERNTEEIRLMRAEMLAMRQDLSAVQRQIAQIGWGLSLALVAVVVAALAF